MMTHYEMFSSFPQVQRVFETYASAQAAAAEFERSDGAGADAEVFHGCDGFRRTQKAGSRVLQRPAGQIAS